MQIKLAMVQPKAYSRFMGASPEVFGPDSPPETANLAHAEQYAEQATAAGAQIVAFPELYPGPGFDPSDLEFDEVCRRMARKARELKTHLFFGGVRRDGDRAWNTYNLARPDGGEMAGYSKMIPAFGEPAEPGASLGIFDLPFARVGVAICLEAWFPELPRALAFSGVDLILFPTGGLVYELRDSWRTLLAARAAENLVYTASSLNLFGVESGLGYVFSPEGLLEEKLDEGIIFSELDLERLAYLRAQDEAMTTPKLYRAIPGTQRALRPAVVEAYCSSAREVVAGR